MTVQLRADIFPVVITLFNEEDQDEITIEKARVLITLDHVYIFQDSQPTPRLVFEDRLTSYTPPPKATRVKAADLNNRFATFDTEDGFTAKFQRMSSCGCGSRLKRASIDDLLNNGSITQAASTGDSA